MFLFDDALLAALLAGSLAPEAAGAAAIGSLAGAGGAGMAMAGTGGGLLGGAEMMAPFAVPFANVPDVAPALGIDPAETFGMFDRSLGTQPTTWDQLIGYGKKGLDTLSSPRGLLAMSMMNGDGGQQRPTSIQRPSADSGPVQIAPRFNGGQQQSGFGDAYSKAMQRYLMRRKFGMGA